MQLRSIGSLWNRTREDEVLNLTRTVTIGGAGKSKPERVTIKEPPMIKTMEHINMLLDRIVRDENRAIIDKVLKFLQTLDKPDAAGDDKNTLLYSLVNDFRKFVASSDLMADILGDLVGKDAHYINYECSARQVAELLDAYMFIIGWDRVKALFIQRMRGTKLADVVKADFSHAH